MIKGLCVVLGVLSLSGISLGDNNKQPHRNSAHDLRVRLAAAGGSSSTTHYFEKQDTPTINPYGPGGNPYGSGTPAPTTSSYVPPTTTPAPTYTPTTTYSPPTTTYSPPTTTYSPPTTTYTPPTTTYSPPTTTYSPTTTPVYTTTTQAVYTTAPYTSPTTVYISPTSSGGTTLLQLQGQTNAQLTPIQGSTDYNCVIPSGVTDFIFDITTPTSQPLDLTYNINGGQSNPIQNSHVDIVLSPDYGDHLDIGIGIGSNVKTVLHCNNPKYIPVTTPPVYTSAPTTVVPPPTTAPPYNPVILPPKNVTYTPPPTPRGTYYDRTQTPSTTTCVDTASNYTLACKLLQNTTNVLGYRPGSNQVVYASYCSGTCFSFVNAPNLCQPTYANLLLTDQPNQDVSYGKAISVISTCSCQPAGCQVVDTDTGNLISYKHGDIAYDSCNQKCTCSNGKLINCCRQRKDWRDAMSEPERERFINTFLYAASTEPYRTRVHKLQQVHFDFFYKGIHGGPVFFPWHRWYLLQMENILREIDCRVSIPFWDWSKEATSPFQSIIWNNSLGGFGGNGTDPDGCVTTGPFAYPNYAVRDGTCLKRNFDPNASFATVADIQQLLKTFGAATATAYSQYEENIESGPGLHGAVHCSIGGTMCQLNSADAPEFVLHHCMIDTLWYDYQVQSPANVLSYPPTLLGATMPGTDQISSTGFKASDFLDMTKLPSDNGTVSICYIYSPQFQWVPTLLQPLSISQIQSIPRVTVSSAVPFATLMNMSADNIAQIQLRDNIRNGVTGNAFNILNKTEVRANNSHEAYLGCQFTIDLLEPLTGIADLTNTEDTGTPSPSYYYGQTNHSVPSCPSNIPPSPYIPINNTYNNTGVYVNGTCYCGTGITPTTAPPYGPTTPVPTYPYVTYTPSPTYATTQPYTTQPYTTPAPTTQPYTTPAPTTQPYTTPAPTTQPYTTPAPTTQPYTTPAPTTQPYTTPAPTTQPYTTPAPTTQPYTTPAPTTQPYTTPAPTTQPYTTQQPTTVYNQPTTSAPPTYTPTSTSSPYGG